MDKFSKVIQKNIFMFFLTLMLCVLLYYGGASILPVEYNTVLQAGNEKDGIKLCRGRLLGFDITVISAGQGIFDKRVFDISYSGQKQLLNIKIQEHDYILEAGSKTADILKVERNKFKRVKTNIEYNNIVSICSDDLDRDGTSEILMLVSDKESKYAQKLLLIKLNGSESSQAVQDLVELESVSTIDLADLKPWKIQTADVEGDGLTDISIGVYKTAKFHPVEDKRPFIYNWHENGISPKWRGSRLSKPFDDYIFTDVNNDKKDEIVSIERLEEGRKVLNAYMWKGFGFESIGESYAFDDIVSIQKGSCNVEGGCNVFARVKTENSWKWAVFRYNNGLFEIEIFGRHPLLSDL